MGTKGSTLIDTFKSKDFMGTNTFTQTLQYTYIHIFLNVNSDSGFSFDDFLFNF